MTQPISLREPISFFDPFSAAIGMLFLLVAAFGAVLSDPALASRGGGSALETGSGGSAGSSVLFPAETAEKDAGYAAWTGGGESLPASVSITNIYPLQVANELVCFEWPGRTTGKNAKIVIVVRQVQTDNYGTYATIRLHNEQGGLNLYPGDAQHITGDLQALKYPIGQEWVWDGSAYAAVSIVSDLVSDATVELVGVWVEE